MQRPSGPQSQYRHLVVDLVLVGLLFVNLALIIFDWLFAVEAVRAFFGRVSPAAAAWYDTAVHPNFVLIDLAFVAVFLTDFTISWIVAVVHRLYHRWFFYPFVHWYDLLGCVPIAGFRFLRLLRIITIVYRLHRTGIIDLAETVPGRVIAKYYGVLLEEVSDRVILKMLTDAQDEVIRGGPLLDQIIAEVLEPRKAELSEWVSQRMRTVAAENYERYRDELESYIRRRVGRALQDNTELGMLRTVPVAGPLIRARVERGITEMITHVMNGVAADLTSERNKPVVDEAASVFLDTIVLKQQEGELSRIVIDTIDRSLEVVKRHVSVQQWKLRERAADEDDYARRLAEALRGEPEG